MSKGKIKNIRALNEERIKEILYKKYIEQKQFKLLKNKYENEYLNDNTAFNNLSSDELIKLKSEYLKMKHWLVKMKIKIKSTGKKDFYVCYDLINYMREKSKLKHDQRLLDNDILILWCVCMSNYMNVLFDSAISEYTLIGFQKLKLESKETWKSLKNEIHFVAQFRNSISNYKNSGTSNKNEEIRSIIIDLFGNPIKE